MVALWSSRHDHAVLSLWTLFSFSLSIIYIAGSSIEHTPHTRTPRTDTRETTLDFARAAGTAAPSLTLYKVRERESTSKVDGERERYVHTRLKLEQQDT